MGACVHLSVSANPLDPVTEETSVSIYSEWSFGMESSADVQDWIRSHDRVYGEVWAAAEANARDAGLKSWDIVDIELKQAADKSWRGRAKIEAVLVPWQRNLPAPDKLDAMDAELADEIRRAAVRDMLGKIADIDASLQDLMTVALRLADDSGIVAAGWEGGVSELRGVFGACNFSNFF